MQEKIRKIVLVRPAVEAGEKLGFLPGDLSSKIDPYLRPLYDALHDMLGAERVNRLVERDIIEIASGIYERRTLREAFIIMDEGQNTTIEQMKMFLTRLGFGSKAVVNGDLSQIDLPKSTTSGLKHAIEVLKDVDSIKFTKFSARDVVRHSLVQEKLRHMIISTNSGKVVFYNPPNNQILLNISNDIDEFIAYFLLKKLMLR